MIEVYWPFPDDVAESFEDEIHTWLSELPEGSWWLSDITSQLIVFNHDEDAVAFRIKFKI